jgi:hypothetical protein
MHRLSRDVGTLPEKLPATGPDCNRHLPISAIHADPSTPIVIPGMPHHVTQRGNRRQQTFSCDDDYRAYLDLLKNC